MKKAILYYDIDDKKSVVEESVALSPLDSLIQCLDVMDFNAALLRMNSLEYNRPSEDDIEWIELTFRKDGN